MLAFFRSLDLQPSVIYSLKLDYAIDRTLVFESANAIVGSEFKIKFNWGNYLALVVQATVDGSLFKIYRLAPS